MRTSLQPEYPCKSSIPSARRCAFFLLALFAAVLFGSTAAVGQSNPSTARKDRVYANGAMVDLGAEGAYFKTSGGLELIPWVKLSKFHAATIRHSFQDALDNIRLKAFWVDGEVFENVENGIVVWALQLDDEVDPEKKTPDHKRGAETIRGLVLIKDLPKTLKEGDPVKTFAYAQGGNLKYSIAFGKKDLKILTVARPSWAKPAEWSDVEGRKIQAELVEVAHGQCRFRRDKKEFLFPLDQLNAEDRKRAVAQQSLMRVIPLPEG
jgi:hypothetical protein